MGSLSLVFAGVILTLSFIALGFFVVGVWAMARYTQKQPVRVPDSELPPVSLLKPLKGLEDELEENVESFFLQDYPAPFEILISTTEADDPALEIAHRVAARHPHRAVRFVLSDSNFGLNPKVANLAGALQEVRYDLVYQSDANVRIPATFLRRIVGEYIAKEASILTNVVIGVGEKTIGAALENLQLSAFIAPAMCLALWARVTCVCGKSMLFRNSELQNEFGGLHSVSDVLCEDFVLGERYKAAGKLVVLSPTLVENVNVNCGIERFLKRHSRWLKMRIVLHLLGFLGDLLSNPIGLALIAIFLSGFHPLTIGIAIIISIAKIYADQFALRITRTPFSLRYIWLTLLKDSLLVPLWIYALFSRNVTWRGQKLHFGKQTRLIEHGQKHEDTKECKSLYPSA